jgi:hypothetical protein
MSCLAYLSLQYTGAHLADRIRECLFAFVPKAHVKSTLVSENYLVNTELTLGTRYDISNGVCMWVVVMPATNQIYHPGKFFFVFPESSD